MVVFLEPDPPTSDTAKGHGRSTARQGRATSAAAIPGAFGRSARPSSRIRRQARMACCSTSPSTGAGSTYSGSFDSSTRNPAAGPSGPMAPPACR